MRKGTSAILASADKLGGSIAGLLAGADDVPEIDIALEDIEVRPQVREVFEDAEGENSLADLGKSLRKRQLQAIVVRPNPRGTTPYELVIGERRLRAARLEGLPTLRGVNLDLSDEEAEDAQLAENIHRLNLTQLEEAKRLKRDLDTLGSVEAVLAKHNKSKSWLSKRLALLDLPPQTKRLVTENITADKEVIGQIRTLEKRDPGKAREAVDTLKQRGPKGDARAIAKNAKEAVKPGTKKAPAPARPAAWDLAKQKDQEGGGEPSTATPPNRDHQAPGPVSVFPTAPVKPHQRVLREAIATVAKGPLNAHQVVEAMSDEDKDLAMTHLQPLFDKGLETADLARALLKGLREGTFSAEGEGALALAAFVQGSASLPDLDLAKALQSVQA